MKTLFALLCFVGGLGVAEAAVPEGQLPDIESDALALDEPPMLDPPDAETALARTKHVSKGLRCPVCQGLSVADSNAESARAMYERVEELVAQGYSDAQINDYFVDRYGEWIRLEPSRDGLNMLVWMLPVAAVAFGGFVVAGSLRGRRSSEAAPVDAPPPDVDDSDPYRQRILEELGGFGGDA